MSCEENVRTITSRCPIRHGMFMRSINKWLREVTFVKGIWFENFRVTDNCRGQDFHHHVNHIIMSTTSSCQPLGTCNGSEACEWIHWWKHCAFLWVKWLLGSRKYCLCFRGSGKSAHDSGESSFVLQHTKNWRLRSTFGRWRRQNAQEFLMRVQFHFNEFVLPSNHQKLTDQERFWKMRWAELKRTAI